MGVKIKTCGRELLTAGLSGCYEIDNRCKLERKGKKPEPHEKDIFGVRALTAGQVSQACPFAEKEEQGSGRKKRKIQKPAWLLDFSMAETVGFEPTCLSLDKTISSRSRYDHFDTSPW